MTASEAARIAAVLPLPKKRGAVAPKGFTRRYGNTITARIPVVARDGLDACIYRGAEAPVKRAPPAVVKKARPVPGEEFESTKPPASASDEASQSAPDQVEPTTGGEPSAPPPASSDQQAKEPGNGV
jgi:monofunctional biosynthetic peptidoglycan transglycosylase